MGRELYLNNPILKNLIQFVAINGFEPDDGNYIPVVPDCNSALILNIGKPYERTMSGSGEPKLIKGSHFVGIKSKHCHVKPNHEMKTVSIRFRPGSLPFFLNTNLHELTDQIIDADLLFGHGIFFLEEQLAEDDNTHSMLAKVEAFLLTRLILNLKSNDTFKKIETIFKDPVNCKIHDLRNENISYKKLERDFLRNVGLTPKIFIDIVRFNYATSLLFKTPAITFTEAGYCAGYYDQSHFIKAFRKNTGYTPGQYLEQKSSMLLDNQRIISDQFNIPTF